MRTPYLIMLVVAVVGIVVAFIWSKREKPGAPAIMTIAAVIGLTAGLLHWLDSPQESSAHAIHLKEAEYAAVATQRLAEHLTATLPDARILLILPFELHTKAMRRDAFIDGLKRGLGANMQIVTSADPPLPPAVREAHLNRLEGDATMDIPEFRLWFTAEYFNLLMREYPGDYTLIISLIGLPHDAENMNLWNKPNRPKVATLFGPVHLFADRVASGDVIAAVAHRPRPMRDAKPPGDDLEAAFNKRYLLLTPDNLEQMKEEHPQLFKR